MRLALRQNAVPIAVAGVATSVMAWLGLYGFAWTDYEEEARPAFEALVHGHLSSFLELAPVYGGSLIMRAPFALATNLWGGGELAVYRMVALPCLLAAVVLGVYLDAKLRQRSRSVLARAVVLGVCVANPLTLKALEIGHPEELLGGVLCVAAVLSASRDRPLWAGILLGLAIANKEWALLATGPVLLALCSTPRVRQARRVIICLTSAGLTATAILGPLLLDSAGRFAASAKVAAAAPGALFQPWQVWWFFGASNHVAAPTGPVHVYPMNAAFSTHPGWRLEPGWLGGVSHPLIIAVALPLTLLAWRSRGRAGQPLLLLALLLLLRCALDTWDTSYYPLPFVLALLAWETLYFARTPLLALSASVIAWVSFQWVPAHASPDMQALVFLMFALSGLAAIAIGLYAPNFAERLIRDLPTRLSKATTVSAPVVR